jgi:hypothetical protein
MIGVGPYSSLVHMGNVMSHAESWHGACRIHPNIFPFFSLVQTAFGCVVETFGKLVIVGGESLFCVTLERVGAGGECDESCCNVLDYIKISVFCADRYFVEIFERLSGRLRQAFFLLKR